MYAGLTLDYKLRLWALTSASRAVSAVAELLVTFGAARTTERLLENMTFSKCDGVNCTVLYNAIFCLSDEDSYKAVLSVLPTIV